MKTSLPPFALFLFSVLLLASAPARAEVMVCTSLETMCIQADRVDLVHVASSEAIGAGPNADTPRITFTWDEQLKPLEGGADPKSPLVATLNLRDPAKRAAIQAGNPVLLFRKTGKDVEFTALLLRGAPPGRDSIIADRFQKILTDQAEILERAREWCRSRIQENLSVEVTEQPLQGNLFAGSSVYIRVPAETTWRAVLLEKAKSPRSDERAFGVSNLHLFQDLETWRAVTDALSDPENIPQDDGTGFLRGYYYPVRTAAMTSLTKFSGIHGWQRPATDEEREAHRKAHWEKKGKELVRELPGWTWLSSTAGESAPRRTGGMPYYGAVRYIETIRLNSPKGECSLVMMPEQFSVDHAVPGHELLGITTSYNGQFYVYLSPDFPEAGREHIRRYFGVEAVAPRK